MAVMAPRSYSRAEEAELSSALDKIFSDALGAVDRAVHLRTAPQKTKRFRQIMKTKLEEAGNAGMDALAHKLEDKG